MDVHESLPESAADPGEKIKDKSPHREPLPDIAVETAAAVSARLDLVGMTGIEVMLRIPDEGLEVMVPALADAFVSLEDPLAKGIHMSRLMLILQDELDRERLSPKLARRILARFVESHHELTESAVLRISYTHALQRPSLVSNHVGWRHYPVAVEARISGGKLAMFLDVAVSYSSTCPCSAALSRQLMQQKFQGDFSHHRWLSVAQVNDWLRNHGTIAAPHSQRSVAEVTVEVRPTVDEFPIAALIDAIESSVATVVQSVVQRSDEQEFARQTGANLMFCEDAARFIKRALDVLDGLVDYRIQASHYESLHPHDAVAIVVKGVAGGLRP